MDMNVKVFWAAFFGGIIGRIVFDIIIVKIRQKKGIE